MKKLLCALLLLSLLLTCCAALADGGALAPGSIAYVNNPNPTDRLNLRTKPSAQSVSLGKYYNGTWVTVLGVSGSCPWKGNRAEERPEATADNLF